MSPMCVWQRLYHDVALPRLLTGESSIWVDLMFRQINTRNVKAFQSLCHTHITSAQWEVRVCLLAFRTLSHSQSWSVLCVCVCVDERNTQCPYEWISVCVCVWVTYPLLAGPFRSHSSVQEFFIVRFPGFRDQGVCDVISMNFKHYDGYSWFPFWCFLHITFL